jgi:hypothetical protein
MGISQGRRLEVTLNELKQFFDTYDKVESRIKEVAPLCTNICSCEEITGFSNCGDGDICVRVWSQDCGNDAYYFPLKYLSMTDDEIAECERKKEEGRRRLAEKIEREERKRLERKERREYERLKKKYEGGSK